MVFSAISVTLLDLVGSTDLASYHTKPLNHYFYLGEIKYTKMMKKKNKQEQDLQYIEGAEMVAESLFALFAYNDVMMHEKRRLQLEGDSQNSQNDKQCHLLSVAYPVSTESKPSPHTGVEVSNPKNGLLSCLQNLPNLTGGSW